MTAVQGLALIFIAVFLFYLAGILAARRRELVDGDGFMLRLWSWFPSLLFAWVGFLALLGAARAVRELLQ